MERVNDEEVDGIDLDDLAREYRRVRREMWNQLAVRVGENWSLVEAKCMKQGVGNLMRHDDLTSTLPSPHRLPELPQQINPSFQSMLHPKQYTSQQQQVPSIQSLLRPVTLRSSSIRSSQLSAHCSVAYGDSLIESPQNLVSADKESAHISINTYVSRGVLPADGCGSQEAKACVEGSTQGFPHYSFKEDILPSTQEVHHPIKHFIPMANNSCASPLWDRGVDGIQLQCWAEVVPTQAGTQSLSLDPTRPSSSVRSSSPNLENSECESILSVDSSFGYVAAGYPPKEELVDSLMVRVYDIFAASGHSVRNDGSTSSSRTPTQGDETSSLNKQDVHISKRSLDNFNDNESNNGGDERPYKRQKRQDIDEGTIAKNVRRFACPYFKQNPRRSRSSRACEGPGWHTISRLKEHLYREHTTPIHCRRCCNEFDNEDQLTEHSSSTVTCEVAVATKFEGFDKDQERKLKSRKMMFRAHSEEHKWKIVYLILFPDTGLFELPSPYYDPEVDLATKSPPLQNSESPGSSQFDAFMNRELPRKVRKALEEKVFQSVGESVKNELESIVWSTLEALIRDFHSNAQCLTASVVAPGESSVSAAQTVLPSFVEDNTAAQSQACIFDPTGLFDRSQFYVPPDSLLFDWPDIIQSAHKHSDLAALSDSAYLSQHDAALHSGDVVGLHLEPMGPEDSFLSLSSDSSLH
ncbi:hypothetical protein T440DRAFT_176910 [Plenodomus tracheiphilus IPT5]|uniref:C2H2-type domain-containing protein n=1 Tax=Plenodomus tracheiphilus IPT5 TaxID=1408161 RepID=A0A6A7B101_9PLEO|nr:hypothetical protein T440DRAFT_176910 [Plenodomus tracheiphilus IPT5]